MLSIELLLKSTNYSLIKANSGQKGLDYLHSSNINIDLILLDLMLPDVYGLDFLAAIKNNELHAKIPVIIQSGTSDQNEINKAYKMGIAGFIEKPFNKEVLISTIERILQLHLAA